MRHAPVAIALLLALFAREAEAAKLIAILPLDLSNAAGKLDRAAQASLEEMLRDVTANALTPDGWTVLTGETTIQVLQDNGVDASKCGDQSCHLTMAREIKTEKFISGAVQFVEGEFTASIRLIDTTSGRIVASERLEGKTVKELRKGFEQKAEAFFARGGLVQSAAMKEVKPAPPPAVPPKNVAGSWELHISTEQGDRPTMLLLRQTGDRITGSYGTQGSLAGTVVVNEATGTWSNGAMGRFSFRFSEDGEILEGFWEEDGKPTRLRVNGRRGFFVSGVWDTTWSMGGGPQTTVVTLTQNGASVEGTYSSGSHCSGTLNGRELTGTWSESGAQGRFAFSFSEDGRSFTGVWGNDNDPMKYMWNGKRR